MKNICTLQNEKRKAKAKALCLALWIFWSLWGGWGRTPALAQEVLESQGVRFRLIPGGTYLLGSPEDEPGRYVDEALPHRIELPPFYLAVTEITNAQYGRFLRATGHRPPLYWQDKNLNAPSQPVVGLSWQDAVAFCQWLTRETGVPHQLPNEAQWEAAARGGLTGQPYPWGPEVPDPGVRRANFRQSSLQEGFRLTAPVGSFPPNGFGLFDMAGNVAEWCLDPYSRPNPGGPFESGGRRLMKGGSWLSQARDLRCAARQSAPPHYADGWIGFRVVRSLPQ